MHARAIVCIAAVVVLLGCMSSSLTYTGGGGGGGGAAGHTTNITVGGAANVFSPANDTVAAGSTVTWTWNGGSHTVTFETLNDSSVTMSSGTFLVTFSTAGVYRYRCLIHSTSFGSGMHGSVVVQ